MNRFFYGFIAFIFLFLSIYPFSYVFADEINISGTPIPIQGDITDDQLTDIIVSGITADLVSQGYEIDFSASDGDWDNFKNSILDVIFNQAASGSGFIGEIYNSALYHNLIDEDFTFWYPDTSDDTVLPGLSKRSIYRNLSDGLVNNILEHRSDDSPTPTPSIPDEYQLYIRHINYDDLYWFDWQQHSNFWTCLAYPYNNYTWVIQDPVNGINYPWNNNEWYNFVVSCTPIQTINIVSAGDNLYSCSFTTYNTTNYFKHDNGTLRSNCWLDKSANPYYFRGLSNSAYGTSHSLENQTLTNIFLNLQRYVHNVNIYVDDVPWSIISNPQLPTININPGYVLRGTDYPLNYYFTDPPQFDYQRMIDIIKHALLQYGVIQWEDIADVFVDVNGQTAVAVLSIHRNDYDVLYDEQYPGIALPNRFNTHLLDTSHQYLSPVVQTVEETTGILPGEIKGALAIGMMLTIFACLIHRLLE